MLRFSESNLYVLQINSYSHHGKELFKQQNECFEILADDIAVKTTKNNNKNNLRHEFSLCGRSTT